jgi:hypothetical protein
LADANERRDPRIFEELTRALMAQAGNAIRKAAGALKDSLWEILTELRTGLFLRVQQEQERWRRRRQRPSIEGSPKGPRTEAGAPAAHARRAPRISHTPVQAPDQCHAGQTALLDPLSPPRRRGLRGDDDDLNLLRTPVREGGEPGARSC